MTAEVNFIVVKPSPAAPHILLCRGKSLTPACQNLDLAWVTKRWKHFLKSLSSLPEWPLTDKLFPAGRTFFVARSQGCDNALSTKPEINIFITISSLYQFEILGSPPMKAFFGGHGWREHVQADRAGQLGLEGFGRHCYLCCVCYCLLWRPGAKGSILGSWPSKSGFVYKVQFKSRGAPVQLVEGEVPWLFSKFSHPESQHNTLKQIWYRQTKHTLPQISLKFK